MIADWVQATKDLRAARALLRPGSWVVGRAIVTIYERTARHPNDAWNVIWFVGSLVGRELLEVRTINEACALLDRCIAESNRRAVAAGAEAA